jgi:hypothetical protein
MSIIEIGPPCWCGSQHLLGAVHFRSPDETDRLSNPLPLDQLKRNIEDRIDYLESPAAAEASIGSPISIGARIAELKHILVLVNALTNPGSQVP